MGGVGTASALGPQAIAWNPAALARATGFAVSCHYLAWFLDTYHQALFLNRGLGTGSIALGVSSFAAGSFEYRADVPTEEPLGTFTPTELSLYVNYARPVGRLFQAGVSGRYYYSRIIEQEASGPGVDVGLRAQPWRHLNLGAALADFGRTPAYKRESFRLPTRCRLGAAYEFPFGDEGRVLAALDGSYFVYSGRWDVQTGVEFQWWRSLALRAGYDFRSAASGLTCGLGLRSGNLRLDYSYAPLNLDLGAAHRISLGFGY